MDASDVSARTRTVAQLADVVQAMRTLAGAQRRQAQERLAALARYAAGTRAALGAALALIEESREGLPAGRCRIAVLFSEHGFVGSLDDALLARASALRAECGGDLVAVGTRGRRLCLEKGIAVSDGGAMPTTIAAVQSTAQRLTETLFGEVAEGTMGELHLVFAAHISAATWAPREERIFPPDASPTVPARGVAPLHTLAPRVLVARAMEEYAFAQVNWAVAEAFATERAARFLSMDAARRHIDDKLSELRALEREVRQESITSEILEIAAGAESAGGAP